MSTGSLEEAANNNLWKLGLECHLNYPERPKFVSEQYFNILIQDHKNAVRLYNILKNDEIMTNFVIEFLEQKTKKYTIPMGDSYYITKYSFINEGINEYEKRKQNNLNMSLSPQTGVDDRNVYKYYNSKEYEDSLLKINYIIENKFK